MKTNLASAHISLNTIVEQPGGHSVAYWIITHQAI